MSNSPAERLCRLNRQAIALLELGIPLDLGLGPAGETTATIKRVDAINDSLKMASDKDQSIDDLFAASSIPEEYRKLAQVLLSSSDPAPILRSTAMGQPNLARANRSLRSAFLQPAIILALAWVGVIFLCVHVLPTIELTYHQNFATPKGATAWLLAFKEWLPIWIVVVPVVGILCWLYLPRYAGRLWFRVMPGAHKYEHWIKSASDAARLSATVNSNDAQTEAVQRDPAVVSNPIIHRIVTTSETQDRPTALAKLSRFYQSLAAARYRQFFGRFAGYIGLAFAGSAALAYGLATFLPWVEVLMSLSNEVRPR